ncbi:MAG TPA: hypothetical protein VGM73_08035 [Candidatus Didemnitutus sp.]|jgi:hypothetical protein
MPALIRDLLVFVLIVGGLALPVAQWARPFQPLERMTIGIAGAVAFLGAATFALYASGAPFGCHWILAALAAAGGALTWRQARPWLRTREIGEALGGWLMLVLWCTGGLLLIFSYSGGGWSGDWDEHYQRALFFLYRWPLEYRFIGMYLLPARPPLANLATTGLMALTSDRYVQFQVFTMLLNSLVFFPVLLFARRWNAGSRATALVALGLMLNPSVMENATFAWTKLIAAFFTLTAAYFLVRDIRSPERISVLVAAGAIAAGVLAHYSTVPWLLAFGMAWIFARGNPWSHSEFRGTVLRAAFVFGIPLLGWVSWSVAHYGWNGTLASNTSIAALEPASGHVFGSFPANLWSSIVPYPLRAPDLSFLAQANRLGWLRDYAFSFYQVNLFGLVGLTGLLLLSRAWRGPRREGPVRLSAAERTFWMIGILAVIPLGIGVNGAVDAVGVAHICLQPLTLLALACGLAWLGRELSAGLSRLAVALLAAAVLADLTLGIGLQFAGEAGLLQRSDFPTPAAYVSSLTFAAQANYAGKLRLNQPFLHDLAGLPPVAVMAGMAGLLAAGVVLAWRLRAPGTTGR